MKGRCGKIMTTWGAKLLYIITGALFGVLLTRAFTPSVHGIEKRIAAANQVLEEMTREIKEEPDTMYIYRESPNNKTFTPSWEKKRKRK